MPLPARPISLSLVIPCYDEARSLPRLVERIETAFERDDVEVVLVDNGSRDDTPDVLRSLGGAGRVWRSIRVAPNRGYGAGILAGLREARGTWIGWTHADLQTDPADALRALALAERATDAQLFLKGSRYGRGAADVFFTAGMSLFETVLLRMPLRDINAQPTIFPRSFFESLQDPPEDFSLDLFVYAEAVRAGLTVKRFPVHFGPRRFGTSRWNVGFASRVKFIRRTVSFSLDLRRRFRDREARA